MPLERSDKQPQPAIKKGNGKADQLNSGSWQKRKHHSLFASWIAAASFVEDIAESQAGRDALILSLFLENLKGVGIGQSLSWCYSQVIIHVIRG